MSIMENFRLNGKVAVITGGTGLYGRQMVLALAEAGATVYTVSRNLKANEEYAEKLRAKGLDVYGGQIDQSDEKSVNALIKSITDSGKKIDILVNNSVLRTMQTMEDDASTFAESMKVNATGLFIITRAFAEHMVKNGGGNILNIGSYMGILGPDDTMYRGTNMYPSCPDYFFHKGGMDNFTRYIASYYGPSNIRCNVINLGGFYNGQDPKFVERYNDRTFLKRMANETDIMGAVVFLTSDASSYITGASIPIDGGYSAK